jgi:hypothetical protein
MDMFEISTLKLSTTLTYVTLLHSCFSRILMVIIVSSTFSATFNQTRSNILVFFIFSCQRNLILTTFLSVPLEPSFL